MKTQIKIGNRVKVTSYQEFINGKMGIISGKWARGWMVLLDGFDIPLSFMQVDIELIRTK